MASGILRKVLPYHPILSPDHIVGCLFLGKVAKDMIEKVPNQHHVRPATAGSSSHRQHHGSEGLIRNLDVQQQPDKLNLDPVKVVENILSMQLVLLHLLPLSDGWDII